MAYTTVGKNKMLAALGVTHVSAHTGDPGQTGTAEISNAGIYGRISISFSAPVGGALDAVGVQEIAIPAGTTVTHLGYWDSEDAGAFLAVSAIPPETFNNEGTLTVTDVDLDLNL